LQSRASGLFVPVKPENYLPRFTLLENLIYGRISGMAGLQGKLIEDVVTEILRGHGLWQMVATNLFDVKTNIGGTNLPATFQQRLAFNRAAIKRPDIIVLEQALASYSEETQRTVRQQVEELLPGTTQILLDERFSQPEAFDMHIKIIGGRIDGQPAAAVVDGEASVSDDLQQKFRIISRNELFSNLNPRNQRLLAFAAQWFEAAPGQRIFTAGEPPDAAYLCLSGRAELTWADPDGGAHHVSDVEEGRLIGDLAIILNEPRQLDLTATEPTRFLRIGAEQFNAVIENDTTVLLNLLRTVAGHLTGAADLLRAARIDVPREADRTRQAQKSVSGRL
jgi:CRP-like cAMP-binding protein